jgi:hypothetical protein
LDLLYAVEPATKVYADDWRLRSVVVACQVVLILLPSYLVVLARYQSWGWKGTWRMGHLASSLMQVVFLSLWPREGFVKAKQRTPQGHVDVAFSLMV